MATVDLTEDLKCPICGATAGKTGKPFTKQSQVRGHIVFAHSDKLVKGGAPEPEPAAQVDPAPPDPAPAAPDPPEEPAPRRKTFGELWFDKDLP